MTAEQGTLSQTTIQPRRKWWSLRPSQSETLIAYLIISPWILGFVVFTLGAMLASLGMSFFKTDLLTQTKFIGIDNYAKLVNDELVSKSLINTAYYSFVMVPLGTTIALFIALMLNQDVKLQGLFRTIYYLPSIVSGVAVAVLWAWLYNPELGLINEVLSWFGIQGPRWIYSATWAMPSMIIMSLWGAGGSMLIFLAGLQGIPTVLYEAATIDGTGPVRRFRHVTIPLLTPTIFFSVILGLIGSWQIFTQAYIMTSGGPNNATLTVVLYLYRKAFEQFHFGYASSIAWILFAIIMLFTLAVFKSSELWVFYESELKK